MKKFSIIFPSRDRVELLKALLFTIIKNTTNLEDVEVLVAVDDDDIVTQDYMKNRWPWSSNIIQMFVVPRSMNFSKDYYTYLAKISTGRWIIACNDDCEFQTMGWDVIAEEYLKDKPGVIYGKIEDGLDGYRAPGHGDYRCFPLQGRAGVEALGYFFPDRVPTWGADIWVSNLYNEIDSVVEIPIMIKHISHHNQTREQDDLNKRIMNNQIGFSPVPTYTEANILLEALNKSEAKVS